MTPASNRFGAASSAFAFDGTDSLITLNATFNLPTSDYAIAFWEKSSAAAPITAISVIPGSASLDIVFNDLAAISVFVGGAAVLTAG